MDLEELRKTPHLSASSINEYLDCGLLFKLRRIDKLRSEGTSDALELGSTIHEVLADYYRAKMEGKKLSLEKIHALFTEYWAEAAEDCDDIAYREGKDFEVLLQEGKALLTAYLKNVLNDPFRVLAVEEPFRFEVEGVPIVGVIDLLEEDEAGAIIITDHKTSGRAYGNQEIDRNLQLTLYQMAMKAGGYSDREILLRIDCLIKTKTPKFQSSYTVRTEIDERRVTKKIKAVWDAVRKGVFVPNDGGRRCGYCDLKEYCDEVLEAEDDGTE